MRRETRIVKSSGQEVPVIICSGPVLIEFLGQSYELAHPGHTGVSGTAPIFPPESPAGAPIMFVIGTKGTVYGPFGLDDPRFGPANRAVSASLQ